MGARVGVRGALAAAGSALLLAASCSGGEPEDAAGPSVRSGAWQYLPAADLGLQPTVSSVVELIVRGDLFGEPVDVALVPDQVSCTLLSWHRDQPLVIEVPLDLDRGTPGFSDLLLRISIDIHGRIHGEIASTQPGPLGLGQRSETDDGLQVDAVNLIFVGRDTTMTVSGSTFCDWDSTDVRTEPETVLLT